MVFKFEIEFPSGMTEDHIEKLKEFMDFYNETFYCRDEMNRFLQELSAGKKIVDLTKF